MRSRILILILALVLVAAAALFLLNRRLEPVRGEPTSPVLVDILLPENGSSITVGDTQSILAQAWAPSPLSALQLWVDGELVAVENAESEAVPLKVSWDWEAAVPGVHSLTVKAKDTEGNEGQSSSLLINVNANAFSQVAAGGGQSLEDIGGQFGVPMPDLENLNPGMDPQLPLQDGQPVILPPNPFTGEGQPGGAVPTGPELVIHWQFTPLEQVDKSYCYESLGGDVWHKIPADPFSFFPGDEWLDVSPNPINPETLILMMDCWGWQGGTLKYLGQGQTNLDYAQIPDEIMIVGPGFNMDGLPEQKPLGGGGGQMGDLQIPPPFALREPETVNECASRSGMSFVGDAVCDGLMNASFKQYYVLVWDWQPKFCWPGSDCAWSDHVDGYWLYESDPSSPGSAKWIKDIPFSDQKMAAVPLPWGAKCYAVVAYANLLTSEGYKTKTSDFATYCPGDPPEPEKLVLTPSYWLSSEGMWINEGCENWADAFRLKPSGTQVVVGFFLFADDDYCDIKQGSATAAVQFSNVILPQEAVLQRATLKFNQVDVAYEGPFDVALGNYSPVSCATRIGRANSDWTTLSAGHFIHPDTLLAKATYPYDGKLGSETDVTGIVLGWMKSSSTNHGLILISELNDLLNSYVFESGWDIKICYSLLDKIELELDYFTPQ